jgi:hypothetical protein
MNETRKKAAKRKKKSQAPLPETSGNGAFICVRFLFGSVVGVD